MYARRSTGSYDDHLKITQINELQDSVSRLPPFLFRAFSIVGSRGVNNENEMRPIPAKSLPRSSIFARPPYEIRSMLRSHLLWWYHEESDFISWSSSIIWVLEHAARMHTYENRKEVYVAVLDIRKIEDMAMFPATTLMDVYGVPGPNDPKGPKLKQEYYVSEYLFYGPMRNSAANACYKSVRWEQMCNTDLHGVLVDFSGRSGSDPDLYKRIVFLRDHFDKVTTPEQQRSVVPTAALVGSLFGAELQMIVTVAIMALYPSAASSPTDDYLESLQRLNMPQPVDSARVRSFMCDEHIDARLTEVHRMYKALKDILNARHQPAVPDLAAEMRNLSFGR